MCFLNIFLFARGIKRNNLQTKPNVVYVRISFSWMYTLDLVLNVNKPIFGPVSPVKTYNDQVIFVQFDKSKRPNIGVVT